MAAKVTTQDITDAGFVAGQFGTPVDWDANGGYLARLIGRAEVWSRGRFGAGYDSVDMDAPAGEYLRAAELCWCKAVLWERRAAFLDSNAASAMGEMVHQNRREYEEQARRARECAEAHMALAIDPNAPAGTGGSLSHVVTGPWLARCGVRA